MKCESFFNLESQNKLLMNLRARHFIKVQSAWELLLNKINSWQSRGSCDKVAELNGCIENIGHLGKPIKSSFPDEKSFRVEIILRNQHHADLEAVRWAVPTSLSQYSIVLSTELRISSVVHMSVSCSLYWGLGKRGLQLDLCILLRSLRIYKTSGITSTRSFLGCWMVGLVGSFWHWRGWVSLASFSLLTLEEFLEGNSATDVFIL